MSSDLAAQAGRIMRNAMNTAFDRDIRRLTASWSNRPVTLSWRQRLRALFTGKLAIQVEHEGELFDARIGK